MGQEPRVIEPSPGGPADGAAASPVPVAVRELAAQTRLPLQQALLGILRAQEVPENLHAIARLFRRLKEAMTGKSSYRFWELAERLACALRDGRIPSSQAVLLVLRDLDGRVKYLSETGQVFASSAAEQAFSQRLSDYMTDDDSGAAHRQRDTGEQPAQSVEPMTPNSDSGAHTPLDDETLGILAGLLGELMTFVEDALEHLTYTHADARVTLQQAAATRLQAMAGVLSMLELDSIAGRLQSPVQELHAWTAATQVATEELDRLADILVEVESDLREIPRLYRLQIAGPPVTNGGQLPLDSRYRQAVRAAIGYAIQEIGKARELAATALENNGNADALEQPARMPARHRQYVHRAAKRAGSAADRPSAKPHHCVCRQC